MYYFNCFIFFYRTSLNNEQKTMDVAPFISNNRTYLPTRYVSEPFGAEAEWKGDMQQTIIKIPIEQR